jgi:hypothetical protein
MSGSYIGGHTILRLQRPKGEKPKNAARAYWKRIKQGGSDDNRRTATGNDLTDATTQTRVRKQRRKQMKKPRMKEQRMAEAAHRRLKRHENNT